MKLIATLIICMSTILSSCSNRRYIDIQVLNPATINLPSNLTNLYIIENQKSTGRPNPSQKEASYSKPHFFNQLTNSFNQNLKKNLEESPLFQHTSISVKRIKDVLEETRNLSFPAKEKQIIVFSNWGLLIDTSHIHSYFSNYLAFCRFKINISNLGSNAILDTHQFIDTLIWDIQEYSELREFPQEAINEIGRVAAKKYSYRIAPYWTTEERQLFYCGNSQMRKGYNKFVTNDYEEAKAIWEKVYETGTKRLAAKSALNVALTYELLDDLDNCEKWLQKSLKSMQYVEAINYLKIIQKRKAMRSILDKQIK